ncbi:malonyl CoA-ACP transacylase [Moesziomyces antarcticus]|uniref:[acyl-carrier-protein] S-malonyltransferase n=1 Tax=Pseudozyma antarctica TaxID=84753 RepID=A0A5C3FJ86_PSEA2|nr:malonyl CoA-ACP transacylase [Moesziomyces antarcticus]GAK63844.1 malonyl CoA-ACP transacylase [Moesziomyces antarcticus]SPO44452.1 related to Malonyl CoA-acyl carrier protein transacylase [Moesziomyces antarcticus]
MVSAHRYGGAARELLSSAAYSRSPVAGPSRPRHSSTAISTAPPPTTTTALSRRQSLAQIRDPAYVARYRTLGPSAHPLLSSSSTLSSSASTEASASSAGHAGISTTHASRSSAAVLDTAGPAAHPASSSVRSKSTNASDQLDDTWAFGGGAKSQGGPVGSEAPTPASHAKAASAPIVMGNAGKGAIPNYGKRKMDTIHLSAPSTFGGGGGGGSSTASSSTSKVPTDEALANRYEHRYSPSTRSEHPLPQHTYFSSPSSSFNASSFVAPGTQPPLAGTATGGVGQGHPGIGIVRKKTALIFPGQGSQYVAMSKDLYKAFRSARSVWHQAEEALMATPGVHSHHFIQGERAHSAEQRELFEAELAKTRSLDPKQGLSASGTAVARSRRGWLRDLVFSGDQLELTRAENAQPAILTCTLAFLNVLRKEFSIDLVRDHVQWASGHGSGVYAALVGSGAMDMHDAVRLLRHRGLVASHYTAKHPVLFPPGCTPPESIYETWAFANAGSGKGADLLYDEDAADASVNGKQPPGWKRTQMSGVVVRPGKLGAVLREVEQVSRDIREGKVASVARDEVVEVANINSQLQIVLSGTRVGVSYCCDRLRSKNLGARAVNLPVSGAYHTSLMLEASDFLRPAVKNMPLSDAEGFALVSSRTGRVMRDSATIRDDLAGAFAMPVDWLSSIDTLIAQGVERFVCLGPGRACAHLLSKELAYRDKQRQAHQPDAQSAYEVWSLATLDDVQQLAEVLADVSKRQAILPAQPAMDADRLTADGG